jgi:hypothetical protein
MAFIFLFIYITIVQIVKNYNILSASSQLNINLFRNIFYGVSLADILFIEFLKQIFLKEDIKDTPQMIFKKIQNFSILSMSLCLSPATCGLVLFFLTKLDKDFYMFFVFSIVVLSVYCPRYSQWEEILKKRGINLY